MTHDNAASRAISETASKVTSKAIPKEFPKETPLWDRSSHEDDFLYDCPASGRVDVAIVGGGYTGLSTALHCGQRGLSAHVLEAEHIGFGGSGRNVGLVNAGAWLPPRKVRDVLGKAHGSRFITEFGRAPDYVFSLIEQHQIRCEPTRTGTIHAARGPAGLDELKARKADWDRLGAPVALLSRRQATKLIGSDAFHGGLLDHRAGTINPMGYCRGLARAARGAGARISTGAKVTALQRDGDQWRVVTSRGELFARAVVLATNAYTDDLWPGLDRSFLPIHFFQLATEPLGPDAAHILPQRQGLWDTGRIMFSLRRDNGGRLIVGSMGTVVGGAHKGLSHRWANKQVNRIFPSLGPVQFEQAWHGRIAMTRDHLPRVYQLAENLYTPIGYNGRGVTTGTIFGRAMAGLLTGEALDTLPLPISGLGGVTSAPLLPRLYQLAFTANQLIKSV